MTDLKKQDAAKKTSNQLHNSARRMISGAKDRFTLQCAMTLNPCPFGSQCHDLSVTISLSVSGGS